MTTTPPPAGWGTSIVDMVPDPTVSELARVAAICERKEIAERSESARSAAEAEGRATDRVDNALSKAFASGRDVPSHLDVLQAASLLGDLDDLRAEAARKRELSESGRAEIVGQLSDDRVRARADQRRIAEEFAQNLRRREAARARSGASRSRRSR